MDLSLEEALECIHGTWFRWDSQIKYRFEPLQNNTKIGKLLTVVTGKTVLGEYEYEFKFVDSLLKLRIGEKWYTVITLDPSKATLKILEDGTGKQVLFTYVHSHMQLR